MDAETAWNKDLSKAATLIAGTVELLAATDKTKCSDEVLSEVLQWRHDAITSNWQAQQLLKAARATVTAIKK